MMRAVHCGARRSDQMTIPGRAAQPFEQSCGRNNGTGEILVGLFNRASHRGSARKMEDRRRRAALICQRVKIWRVDLAVDPVREPQPVPIGFINHTMSDTVHGLALVGEMLNE